MIVIFEENSSFRAARVIQEESGYIRAETLAGKKLKLKTAQVSLCLKNTDDPGLLLLIQSQFQDTKKIDKHLLWECLSPGDYNLTQLSECYFGDITDEKLLILLLELSQGSIYFYKRAGGVFRRASPENVQAALLGVERRQKQQTLIDSMASELILSRCPQEWTQEFCEKLIFKKDTAVLDYKALEKAAQQLQISIEQLMLNCGVFSDIHDYHIKQFLFNRPRHPSVSENFVVDQAALEKFFPVSDTAIFTIDDEETREIDDGFSIQYLDHTSLLIGIHIAVPTLFVFLDEQLQDIARSNLLTIYTPALRDYMLPLTVIDAFSLNEGEQKPCISLYLTIDLNTKTITEEITKLETVFVKKNLRTPNWENIFSESNINNPDYNGDEFFKGCLVLYDLAQQFYVDRTKDDSRAGLSNNRKEYHFSISDNGEVDISLRARHSPVNILVSEMMIKVNHVWSQRLSDFKMPGIYRGTVNDKVRLSSTPVSHVGMNLSQYAWISSPLRRYVDLVNQYFLIQTILDKDQFAFAQTEQLENKLSQTMIEYEEQSQLCSRFQSKMELYWALIYLKNQDKTLIHSATVISDRYVALDHLPITLAPSGVTDRLSYGQTIWLKIDKIDLWTLTVNARHVSEPQRPNPSGESI